ncbi:glutamate-5-semialdehyde dehydrogenase [Sediminispirochaeta smaragdinae]|jgi:glutamate-5-semialdehyde dehydrogenase|uniref:Gamma-glutamyl phosphate reductase n=1 Tax=Sediminispirochaeta smaragdinae (strain DSM 11293 / JCM 15392 / SEBR 4228) TaxID=573413 RepID=E1R3R7_SEDSS|nr:glutamate-5-semialdehyde dehydrogenase [Sediminispirochaeta smaragdinae]ADK82038.1 gamma-glutamyl phosphate reductase [Sediminispirochaeta smaragdinae DSM 11293]
MSVREKALMVKDAQILLGAAKGSAKNDALVGMKQALRKGAKTIFEANRADLDAATQDNLSAPLLKRLKFDETKLDQVIAGIDALIGLPDPAGKILEARKLDEGLNLYRVSCPIGVIGMIFESRPDALVQIASLALKSGNGLLLKGGSEALRTNRALASLIAEGSVASGAPKGWMALLESREEVGELLELDDLVDLLIPRGSNDFVRHIMKNSSIPVLGHADGICHLYLAEDADEVMSVSIAVDSKTQYMAVCNALETLLVDEAAASRLLPPLQKAFQAAGVELRGCDTTRSVIDVAAATEEDWRTEYLGPILSIRVVKDIHEAVAHINRYGSGHTDAIVTNDPAKASFFMARVDSADLFWNCSTRFSDGYRYGLGAEVGISTNKIHARGPVGLEGLMIYKWRMIGSGQIVDDYASGRRSFLHQDISADPSDALL